MIPIWSQCIGAFVGMWLMGQAAVFGYVGTAAAFNERSCGPIAAAAFIVGMFQCTRRVRHVGVPVGLWIALSPIWFSEPAWAVVCSVVSGLTLIGSAVAPSPRPHAFASGWTGLVLPRGTR